MKTESVRFAAGHETLAGLRVLSANADRSGILFLHGAGKATKERALPIAERLASLHGRSSFLFDFSGHGESTGTLEESSLAKRVREAKAAMHEARFATPVSICAFSMGGHIALELLKDTLLRALMLFYPGIYSKKAVQLPFGQQFSAKIREPNSWADTDLMVSLRAFAGNVLLVRGSADTVIPGGVFDLIRNCSANACKFREIVVHGAPHLVLPNIYDNNELFEDVCATIADFSNPAQA